MISRTYLRARSLRSRLSLIARTSIIGCLVIGLSGCPCPTKARIEIARGTTVPTDREGTPAQIIICPREQITVGWAVSSANGAKLNGSTVAIPSGSEMFTPEADTKYEIVADGSDCNARASKEVLVVTEGKKVVISAQKVTDFSTGNFYYQAELPEMFYSPNILVTSIALNYPTAAGWFVRKTDNDGTLRQFEIGNLPTSPWQNPIQLIRLWHMLPKNPNELGSKEQAPLAVEFVVTLKCKT